MPIRTDNPIVVALHAIATAQVSSNKALADAIVAVVTDNSKFFQLLETRHRSIDIKVDQALIALAELSRGQADRKIICALHDKRLDTLEKSHDKTEDEQDSLDARLEEKAKELALNATLATKDAVTKVEELRKKIDDDLKAVYLKMDGYMLEMRIANKELRDWIMKGIGASLVIGPVISVIVTLVFKYVVK